MSSATHKKREIKTTSKFSTRTVVNLPKGEVLPSLGIVEEDTVHFPSPWEQFAKALLQQTDWTLGLYKQKWVLWPDFNNNLPKLYKCIWRWKLSIFTSCRNSTHLGEGGWYFANEEVDCLRARFLAVLHNWAKTTLRIRVERAWLVVECSWVPIVYVTPGVSKEGNVVYAIILSWESLPSNRCNTIFI